MRPSLPAHAQSRPGHTATQLESYYAHGLPRGQPVSRLPRPTCEHRLTRQWRSEEHTSELQSLMRISYAVFCLKKKTSPTKSRNLSEPPAFTACNVPSTIPLQHLSISQPTQLAPTSS